MCVVKCMRVHMPMPQMTAERDSRGRSDPPPIPAHLLAAGSALSGSRAIPHNGLHRPQIRQTKKMKKPMFHQPHIGTRGHTIVYSRVLKGLVYPTYQ